MSLFDFGRRLVETLDLDPVYVLVKHSGLAGLSLRKWLLSYWCFYHVGTACELSNRIGYWDGMEAAAATATYPRCTERRHFRGIAAIRSVAYLKEQGIDRLFKPLLNGPISVSTAMAIVQQWVGFGPWIAFKVADMIERLGMVHVSFDSASAFLFDSPREGARIAYERYGSPEGEPFDTVEEWAVESILDRLGDLLAPPGFDRPIGPQEAETILCKWKSHVRGRYHVGEDIDSCRKALERFPECPVSNRFLEAGRIGKLWR